MIDFKLISGLPDIEQANRRVEAVEDGKRHRDVGDDHPSPLPEELQVRWPEACVSFDQSVDEPHRNVCDEQESHNLTTWPLGIDKKFKLHP